MAAKKKTGFVGKIVGKSEILPISRWKPNPWNPNRMTPQERKSLAHGLREDGWLAAQALLVWGKDDRGVQRDLVIDGQHRWEEATRLGFTDAPTVVMDGLTEAAAKELTLKFIYRRGQKKNVSFDSLEVLIRDLDLGSRDDVELSLGISARDLDKITNYREPVLDTSPQLSGMIYQVIVSVDSSESQRKLIEKLEAEGLDCKPFII